MYVVCSHVTTTGKNTCTLLFFCVCVCVCATTLDYTGKNDGSLENPASG